MQRTGRSASKPRRPSNERNSPGLNLTESQTGHARRINNTRGSQFGQIIVLTLIKRLLSTSASIGSAHSMHGFHAKQFVTKLRRIGLHDLACMQRNIRDPKAWIASDANGIKLSGVELARNRVECTRQSTMGCVFRRQPKPLRAHEPGIHIECQPAWRIIVSKIDAVISSTSFQLSPKGFLTGSRRLGRTHPLRRKTECGFTLARFLMFLVPGRRWIRSNWRAAVGDALADRMFRRIILGKRRWFCTCRVRFGH